MKVYTIHYTSIQLIMIIIINLMNHCFTMLFWWNSIEMVLVLVDSNLSVITSSERLMHDKQQLKSKNVMGPFVAFFSFLFFIYRWATTFQWKLCGVPFSAPWSPPSSSVPSILTATSTRCSSTSSTTNLGSSSSWSPSLSSGFSEYAPIHTFSTSQFIHRASHRWCSWGRWLTLELFRRLI